MRAGRLHIGTSGWIYKHWRECVYPREVRQIDWLPFITRRFDTVEVNSSFYRIPKPEMMERWSELAPRGFRFALKLWRGITHYDKLRNAGAHVARFLEVAELLPASHRAPLLIQLPPNQGIDIEKLDAFLSEWKTIATSRWRLAVEFRNDSWLSPETYAVLDRHRAALCIHDMVGRAATNSPNSRTTFVYVRRHGPDGSRYHGSYTDEHRAADAASIREWLGKGRDVFVYFNNDIGGHAFHNAIALKHLLATVST